MSDASLGSRLSGARAPAREKRGGRLGVGGWPRALGASDPWAGAAFSSSTSSTGTRLVRCSSSFLKWASSSACCLSSLRARVDTRGRALLPPPLLTAGVASHTWDHVVTTRPPSLSLSHDSSAPGKQRGAPPGDHACARARARRQLGSHGDGVVVQVAGPDRKTRENEDVCNERGERERESDIERERTRMIDNMFPLRKPNGEAHDPCDTPLSRAGMKRMLRDQQDSPLKVRLTASCQ